MINIFKKKKKGRIFIIASPRSGTTWLNTALNIHPEIYATENRLFGNYTDFVLDNNGKSAPRLRVTLDKYVKSILLHYNTRDLKGKKLDEKLTRKLLEAIHEFNIVYSNKKIIIDKITPYVGTAQFVLNQITKYFPNSKIIYLIRDGRDVLTSGVFHWFDKKLIDAPLNLEKKIRKEIILLGKKSELLNRFFFDSEIEEWGKIWAEPIATINKAKRVHKIHIIKYEEMLSKQKNVLDGIFKFLNVKSSTKIISNCVNESTFKKMKSSSPLQNQFNATAHIRKGIHGDWVNYFTKKDGELFLKYTGSTLIKNGYEKNDNWVVNLPDTINIL